MLKEGFMTAFDPKRSVGEEVTDDRSSAKGDIGISIGRVCCTRKTGRWLDPRS